MTIHNNATAPALVGGGMSPSVSPSPLAPGPDPASSEAREPTSDPRLGCGADPDAAVDYPPPPENGTTRALGTWGEEVAARHLEATGATLMARNWRCRWGELDLVVAQGRSVRAIEVKTRRAGGRVPALDAISPRKYARLRRLLGLWLVEAGVSAPEIAVDLVAVTLRGGRPDIAVVRDI